MYACTVDFSKLRFFGGQVNIFDLIAFWSCVSLCISVMRTRGHSMYKPVSTEIKVSSCCMSDQERREDGRLTLEQSYFSSSGCFLWFIPTSPYLYPLPSLSHPSYLYPLASPPPSYLYPLPYLSSSPPPLPQLPHPPYLSSPLLLLPVILAPPPHVFA